MEKRPFKILRKYMGPPGRVIEWVDGVPIDVVNPPNVKRVKYSADFREFDEEKCIATYVTLTFDHSWDEMCRCTSPGVSYYSELVKAFK